MAKISGSYERIMLGVSQQTPQDRREGQHWEQINCISDPVRGIVRRQGSKHETTKQITSYNAEHAEAFINDVKTYRSFDFLVGDDQFTICYRKKAKPANSAAPFCFVFNKQTREFINVETDAGNDLIDTLEAGGVSAITNVGRYVYIAGNTVVPEYTTTDVFGSNSNKQKSIVWIRNGQYSKTYKVKISLKKLAVGVDPEVQYTIEGEYTTMSSAYPGVLDTSDIPATDPEYQKKVNDRTNDYNTAVTQHIGLSAEDVLQSNIVAKLILELEADRDSQSILSTQLLFESSNNTIGIVAGTGFVIEDVVSSDKGDNTSALSVSTTVASVDKLSAEHYPGKIIKVIPTKSDESNSYYMKAVKREESVLGDVLQEVSWIQTAGVVVQIGEALAFGTVESNTFYLAGTSSDLETMTGLANIPNWEPSAVGDTISSAIPQFLGKKIDYLGSFQDRLIIGNKSTLLFSRPGDYLNMFRADVLSVLDNDPVEIYPNGSEDDTIKAGSQFQGSVLLFGNKKQYMLNGKLKFTPSTALITTVGAHEDSIDMDPIAAGNFVFYGKSRLGYSSLHQFQGGYVADTPESYEISAQVDKYMPGNPVQAMAITTPNTILLRTDGFNNGLFLYSYMDAQDGSSRMFDSWSKWQWDEQLGKICGWTFQRGDISVFTVRHGNDWDDNNNWYIVSDKFTLDTKLDTYPYLDSLRPYNTYISEPEDEWFTSGKDNSVIAFDNTVNQFLIGQPLEEADNLVDAYPSSLDAMHVGIQFDAYVSPTNPFVRDQQGKSIVDARTTINQFVVSVSDTAGVISTVHTKQNPDGYQAGYTNGRELGRLNAELGVQPISSGSFRFLVGRDNTEFEYRVKAVKWFPLTISAITYIGQFFSRTRRIT